MKHIEYDPLVTKKELAEKLDTSTRTIATYHKIAVKAIDDYVESFPKMGGKPATSFKLNAYQQWCLHKLQEAVNTFRNLDIISNLLINDLDVQSQFSLEKFNTEYKETSNESKAISN